MNTQIIIDSTVDLAPQYRGKCPVVPLTVHFGPEELIDGVTINRQRFYERLATKAPVSPPANIRTSML